VRLFRVQLLFATTTCGRSLVTLLWRGRLRSEMNNREGLEWILRGLILESLLVPGPGSAFKEKTMDADTLRWDLECLFDAAIFATDDFLLDLCLRLN